MDMAWLKLRIDIMLLQYAVSCIFSIKLWKRYLFQLKYIHAGTAHLEGLPFRARHLWSFHKWLWCMVIYQCRCLMTWEPQDLFHGREAESCVSKPPAPRAPLTKYSPTPGAPLWKIKTWHCKHWAQCSLNM